MALQYVKEFDGLRAFLALWVVLGHWASTINVPSFLFGQALFNHKAVVVFIILSGFAIASMVASKPESYRLYIARRILRIFPVYLLFLFLSVMAAELALQTWSAAPDGAMKLARVKIAEESVQFWPYHLAAHIPALHGLVPDTILPSAQTAFLGQAWSITLEWQFYLIAPMLIALLFTRWTPSSILTVFIGALAVFALSRVMNGGFVGKWLPYFLVGIGTLYFVRHRLEGSDWAKRLPLCATWVVLVATIVLMGPLNGLPIIIWLTVAAVVIATREGTSRIAAQVSRILLWGPVQAAGKMTYSVYLSHMLVLVVGLNVLPMPVGAAAYSHALSLLAFVLCGTLMVSILSYQLVEKPFHNLGRRIGERRTAAAPELP